ncbi:hypothetical protein [Streptomyces sp. NPDC020141]|uniref:hypothetical protein n=1 Tax=Streptomyces sp. NPDC020141 TaxID=3365065 RepID=UPI0037AFBFB0
MYLIHLALEHREHGRSLPDDVREVLVACAAESDALEHVTVHGAECSRQVIGLFLGTAGLAEAEAATARIWRRAVARDPRLRRWELRRAEAPLLRPDDGWFDCPRPD